MKKPADKDILEALEFVERNIKMTYEIEEPEDTKRFRQIETVLRRLAREAGYAQVT